MIKPRSDIARYKGIHILLSQKNEHASCILDNGTQVTYYPFYIERKLFHTLLNSTDKIWASTILNAKDIAIGNVENIIRYFLDSPCEIMLILVTEDSSLNTLGRLSASVLKDQSARMRIFVQKLDSFLKIKKDADRQLLNSKYGRYCIEKSFPQSDNENVRIRITYTNPAEVEVRNIILEQGFRI